MDIDGWIYFVPNYQQTYKIHIFDDGNDLYEDYENKWLINGEWKGKVSLVNLNNHSIIINSISRWKLLEN